ncbi:alpha-glucosidase [Bacillus carboniphilus]|uniref:Alpha-amylase n=1 Tax=Bacillus carboniphilus TaxID=86663 RepID=A0ABY9JS90_9BACI|nr:alpha-glucosidase [Bacillus carboniphilus]WLR41237.1 alpha-glucosidase [Bacillus carboniphilus]
MTETWWKEAVVYQIYPRSFMDANNDGIGDLQGVMLKLDYLKELGIDIIWICPMYKSPNADNGYDISDYYAIMEEFGDMNDFDLLLKEVHNRGMKLILDLVINHTSDEHPWFLEARKSKGSNKRDWYIWKDGVDGKEPNNWESIFGGSAWEYDVQTGQYYLHVFDKKQPDLNWENKLMREAIYEMMNWWLNKGIDGFRVDAISHIKKQPGLPSLPNPKQLEYVPSFDYHMNVKGIMDFLFELKEQTIAQFDIMTVGEANGVKIEEAEQWVGEENGIFNMIFQFEHLGLWDTELEGSVDVVELKKTLSKWQEGLHLKGWNALFIENHDQPRAVSVWGNDEQYLSESAKALAVMYFLMQGTPFIYQGQEIGMKNVHFSTIEQYNDVGMKKFYEIETEKGRSHEEVMKIIQKKGRDNSRTPMQWNDTMNGGFSKATPWFGENNNYIDTNVEQQLKEEDSILNFYKKLIQLRKYNKLFIYGKYELILENHPQIFAYQRSFKNEIAVVIVNLSDNEAHYQNEDILLSSDYLVMTNYQSDTHYNITSFSLNPYEARVISNETMKGIGRLK